MRPTFKKRPDPGAAKNLPIRRDLISRDGIHTASGERKGVARDRRERESRIAGACSGGAHHIGSILPLTRAVSEA